MNTMNFRKNIIFILDNKYKILLKNENKNMFNSSNNTNSITIISNNDNELKKVKEENEKKKKKIYGFYFTIRRKRN